MWLATLVTFLEWLLYAAVVAGMYSLYCIKKSMQQMTDPNYLLELRAEGSVS